MTKVLVTGDTGFIGSSLVKELCNKGYYVLGISRSEAKFQHYNYKHYKHILNLDGGIACFFENHNFDYVYHFAANPIVKNYKMTVTCNNVTTTHRILDDLEKVKFQGKLVFASSATVYGPHSTARSVRGNTYPNDSVYALSKKMSEDLILWYSNNYKIGKILICRYCAHVGPGSTHGLVHDIVNKLKSDTLDLELFGNEPGSIKPFLHIEDSIRETIRLAETTEGICNISPNDNISVKEVAETIMEELSIKKPIKWLGEETTWPGDQKFVFLESLCKNIRPSKQAIKNYVSTLK